MKILLINIDSRRIPNLALKKIEKYYLDRNAEVIWDYPLAVNHVDKVYVSCIFDKNRNEAIQYESYKNAIIGGSGYDIAVKLPNEIERINPAINIGFTSRGCIRKCPFCIVPAKEGKVHEVGDIYSLWDGASKKVTLLDNNVLALPNHFKRVCDQIRRNKLAVDFNQGLDIRLINNAICKELETIKITKHLRFAWDNMREEKTILSKLNLVLKHFPASKVMVYLLCGYNTSFKDDLYRKSIINKLGCDAYIMPYHSESKLLNEFARYNNRFYFRKLPFSIFLKSRNNLNLLPKGMA